jgi:hypothetical protein
VSGPTSKTEDTKEAWHGDFRHANDRRATEDDDEGEKVVNVDENDGHVRKETASFFPRLGYLLPYLVCGLLSGSDLDPNDFQSECSVLSVGR